MPEKLNQLLKNPKRVLMGIIVISVLLRVFTGIVFYGNQIQSLPGTFDQYFLSAGQSIMNKIFTIHYVQLQ